MSTSLQPIIRQWRPRFACLFSTTKTLTSTHPSSPLLLKLRSDVKTAMKAKDAARLSVLRSVLSDITNASKTSTPITTDMQVLSLLRKRSAAASEAAELFRRNSREDLAEKEMGQREIIEEYAGSVITLGEEEIRRVLEEIRARLEGEGVKINVGSLLKATVGPGGALDGRPVEKDRVASIAKQILGI